MRWRILLGPVKDRGQIVLQRLIEIFEISSHMFRLLIAYNIIINDIS